MLGILPLERKQKIAHRYAAAGLGVVPIQPDSKLLDMGALGRRDDWDTRPATTTEIDKWLDDNPNRNIGLVCGIGNLRVFDFEDEDEYERFHHIVSMLQTWGKLGVTMHLLARTTAQVRSPKGRHLYVKAPPIMWHGGNCHYQDLAGLNGPSVCNLLHSRRYVVAPPSRVEGGRYQALDGRWNTGDGPIPIWTLTHSEMYLLASLCQLLGNGNFGSSADYDDLGVPDDD